MPATIGKTVRGRVEDAHDPRAVHGKLGEVSPRGHHPVEGRHRRIAVGSRVNKPVRVHTNGRIAAVITTLNKVDLVE